MKPVDQTVVDPVIGNCWSACLASLLEISLEEVPHFATAPDVWEDRQGRGVTWLTATLDWLNSKGLKAKWKSLPEAHLLPYEEYNRGIPVGVPVILSGHSLRYEGCLHATIAVFDGKAFTMLHDPHPSRAGLKGDAVDVFWVVPL